MAVVVSVLLGCALAVPALAQRPKKVEVEGVVRGLEGNCPSLTFTIGGAHVRTDQSTKFDDGTCTDVANGRQVEVDGIPQDDGVLRAIEVDLD